jgi:hypothetical protein
MPPPDDPSPLTSLLPIGSSAPDPTVPTAGPDPWSILTANSVPCPSTLSVALALFASGTEARGPKHAHCGHFVQRLRRATTPRALACPPPLPLPWIPAVEGGHLIASPSSATVCAAGRAAAAAAKLLKDATVLTAGPDPWRAAAAAAKLMEEAEHKLSGDKQQHNDADVHAHAAAGDDASETRLALSTAVHSGLTERRAPRATSPAPRCSLPRSFAANAAASAALPQRLHNSAFQPSPCWSTLPYVTGCAPHDAHVRSAHTLRPEWVSSQPRKSPQLSQPALLLMVASQNNAVGAAGIRTQAPAALSPDACMQHQPGGRNTTDAPSHLRSYL